MCALFSSSIIFHHIIWTFSPQNHWEIPSYMYTYKPRRLMFALCLMFAYISISLSLSLSLSLSISLSISISPPSSSSWLKCFRMRKMERIAQLDQEVAELKSQNTMLGQVDQAEQKTQIISRDLKIIFKIVWNIKFLSGSGLFLYWPSQPQETKREQSLSNKSLPKSILQISTRCISWYKKSWFLKIYLQSSTFFAGPKDACFVINKVI